MSFRLGHPNLPRSCRHQGVLASGASFRLERYTLSLAGVAFDAAHFTTGAPPGPVEMAARFGAGFLKAPTERRLRARAQRLPDVRPVGGRAVLSILPSEAPTKGDAMAKLTAQYPGRPAAFIGDDEVDAAAFLVPAVALPIRVGHPTGAGARRCAAPGVPRRADEADGIREDWLPFDARKGA